MNKITKEQLIKIYENAISFLISIVGEEVLNAQLIPYLNKKPNNITSVFKQMINSLKNKQGYDNFIADVDNMSEVLFDFNPTKVIDEYGKDWVKLFNKFSHKFSSKYTFVSSNKRNSWVMYSKGVLSCAKFLNKFKDFKEFENFINTFSGNTYKIVALPMLLGNEIYGYGFALACDFLKEVGFTDYGKPDVHIKDIFKHFGIIEKRSDYEAFKMIAEIGLAVKKEPVIVDKVFWLIGSGKFYVSNIRKGRLKEEFYQYYKNINI